MTSWPKICDILKKYANKENEKTYQKSIVDLLFEMNLGWHKNQIAEQLSVQLGSTERLIPDIIVTKDRRNQFVIEVKQPSHIKAQKDIDQLISYMKQLEIPVGIYVGNELDVYYKNIGDGSEPKLIMTLKFKEDDDKGDDFLRLFSEAEFTTEKIITYVKELEKKTAFESNVNDLVSYILSTDFKEELMLIIRSHFKDRGEDIVTAALEAVKIDIRNSREEQKAITAENCITVPEHPSHPIQYRIRRKGRNNGVAQRYAYNLIKNILKKILVSISKVYIIYSVTKII